MGYRENVREKLVNEGLAINDMDYNQFVKKIKQFVDTKLETKEIDRAYINFNSVTTDGEYAAEVLVNKGNKCMTWAMGLEDGEINYKVLNGS